MNVLLDVKDVTVHFGGVRALQAVSFQVFENELLSLIGPNGAGKTTMLRAIIGVVSPPNARIQLDGREISLCPPTGGRNWGWRSPTRSCVPSNP
jgi:branched-chain amino acid transport system ATP-binding protein